MVTLSGFVSNYAEKHAAERAAERVIGVKAVADELRVRLPSAAARSDTSAPGVTAVEDRLVVL